MTIFQVGVGSGGMAVLDLLIRKPEVHRVILIDPDRYEAANAERHFFPGTAAGTLKVDLAADWVHAFRPDLTVERIPANLLDPAQQARFVELARDCTVGVCAADGEQVKYAFDALMREVGRPWTLGEVLAGGIGGWVHRFTPGGACYGCVASRLQRGVTWEDRPPPDYADPQATAPEQRIPAAKAAIHAIASLHAMVTLDVLEGRENDFTSLLIPWSVVPGVFSEGYRPHKFVTERDPQCLICGDALRPPGGNLDVALDQALSRLAHE